MIKQSKTIAMAVAAVMLAFAPVALDAKAQHKNLGASRGAAKSSVNRGGGGNHNKPNKANYANNNGPKVNKNNKNNKRGNNVVAGNTVVVNKNNGRHGGNGGYYNNGRYYDNNNGHWDNDDNDFLEFVGKTAAITAGVSVVAAVIGSTTNDKPDDCQQTVSNGQVYMNCNGTWYQPVQSGNQTQYTVIAPPY